MWAEMKRLNVEYKHTQRRQAPYCSWLTSSVQQPESLTDCGFSGKTFNIKASDCLCGVSENDVENKHS